MIRRVLRVLVYWLSYVIKPKNILVFSSFPDFADNAYALYLYFIKHKQYDKYKKVWFLGNPTPDIIAAIKEIDPNAIISYSTLKNWYYVIVSRYIFSTHNAYGYLHFRQKDKLFNLWHGIAMKKIGFDHGETPSSFFGNNFYTLATSPFFVECMSSAFRIPKEQILLTGLPRNDMFGEESAFYQELVDGKQYNSVGIWMPTFRQTVTKDIIDAPMDEDAINYWNPSVLEELNAFLHKTNNFMILKLHPADAMQNMQSEVYSNICILRNRDLPARFLYPLMGKTDYLISDYSSAFIDYLTTKKPIGFLQNDTKLYQANRSMYFEPTQEILPGPIFRTLDEMEDYIMNYKKYHYSSGEFFNIHRDAHNCERLVKALDL